MTSSSSSSSTLCRETVQPQILTLKLAPSSLQNEGTTKMDGWSFIDSLTTINPTTQHRRPCIAELYVHPLVKLSTDKLSATSLDMCTEVLGNETGSDLILSSDEFSSFLFQLENPCNKNNNGIASKKRSSQSSETRRAFPPPLTSISSSNLRLRPHREDGRFVLRAHTFPSCKETFHAERSHGRLRLRFNASNFCDEAKEEEEEGKFEDEVVYEEEVDGPKNMLCHQFEDNEVDDDENDNDNEEDDEDDVMDIEEKILWTKGCKEERAQWSQGFWNWDSYWVATN